jgi:Dyp-type peroxidase family
MSTDVPTTTDLADIQGNILRAYGMPYARYSFVKILDATAAKALLVSVVNQVTTATTWDANSKPLATLNLSLSYSGLAALRLPDDVLASFPVEFQTGMAGRASMLGDTGVNDPTHWELGGAALPVDGILLINAQSPPDLESKTTELLGLLSQHPQALKVVAFLDAAALDRGTEHFGFADGFGQPDIAGSGARVYPGDGTPVAPDRWQAVQTGEFVLGYPDESSFMPTQPSPDQLGRNGSFMAFRKLKQNVVAFRNYLQQIADAKFNGNVELLAAKMVGRWRSGCPIELSPAKDNTTIANDFNQNNDFQYGGDATATSCPFGAHLRRVNPRDDLDSTEVLVRRHRIVRRGLPYGPWLPDGAPDDGQERGIAFVAINASLARQFEFVQGQWINKGNFTTRMALEERDPLVSSTGSPSNFRVPVSGAPPVRLFNLPDFVTVKGGEYFFIPSITAIRYIADL